MMVRHIESDNNPKASAGTTSAKGVYQFTDASVHTAKQRMWNMGFEAEYIRDCLLYTSPSPRDRG